MLFAVIGLLFFGYAMHICHKAQHLQEVRQQERTPWWCPPATEEELLYRRVGRLFLTLSLSSFFLFLLTLLAQDASL